MSIAPSSGEVGKVGAAGLLEAVELAQGVVEAAAPGIPINTLLRSISMFASASSALVHTPWSTRPSPAGCSTACPARPCFQHSWARCTGLADPVGRHPLHDGPGISG